MSVATDTCQIVPMEPEHLEAVAVLEARAFSEPWSAAMFRDALVSDCRGWVLMERDTLAGYIVTQTIIDELHILNIAVGPEFRRRGLASKLLDHVLADDERLKIGNVYLEVRVGNVAAISLYQRYAFETIARRRGYYPDGEDAYVMCKRLNEPTNAQLNSETQARS